MKFCSKCKTEKDNTEFNKNSSNSDGLQDRCRECQKKDNNNWIKNNPEKAHTNKREGNWKTHGITMTYELYKLLFDLQEGKCLICGSDNDKKRLSVDHCHKTGRIRGLLCAKCNTGVGMFRDSETNLKLAAEYVAMTNRDEKDTNYISKSKEIREKIEIIKEITEHTNEENEIVTDLDETIRQKIRIVSDTNFKCMNCELFFRGRRRKFCSDKCRIDYYEKKRKEGKTRRVDKN